MTINAPRAKGCRCWIRVTCEAPGCKRSTLLLRSEFEADVGFALPETIAAACPDHRPT